MKLQVQPPSIHPPKMTVDVTPLHLVQALRAEFTKAFNNELMDLFVMPKEVKEEGGFTYFHFVDGKLTGHLTLDMNGRGSNLESDYPIEWGVDQWSRTFRALDDLHSSLKQLP